MGEKITKMLYIVNPASFNRRYSFIGMGKVPIFDPSIDI